MTAGPLAFDGSTIDGGLYSTVTGWAHAAPPWLDLLVRIWSGYGLALFGLLMLGAWWWARDRGPVVMARVLAAPLVVVAAYLANLVLKGLVEEVRPCRQLPGPPTLEACPPPGDWSFPSSHTVIAFASAAVLWSVRRRLGRLCAVAALLMAASRVWVGAHYPHDVLAGALTGLLLATPLALLAARAAPLVDRARAGALAPVLGAGPGAHAIPA